MNSAEEIKSVVRSTYTEIVSTPASSCCGTASNGPCGCGCSTTSDMAQSYEGVEGYVPEADYALGCGIPTSAVAIREGDTVVDLGSGAGNDAFVARHLVGDRGRVIGVDFTPAMVQKARDNAKRHGFTNVEFIQGDIDAMPLPDATADVVVSNCVLNLVPDKQKAFAEIMRILKPGAHFGISDIVVRGELPASIRTVAQLYAGCISGALKIEEYLGIVRLAGFDPVEVRSERPYPLSDELLQPHLSPEEIAAFRASGASIVSITVHGTKPVR